MKCEKGHVFPFTIALVLFCLMVASAYASIYMEKQRFTHDTKEFYMLETLMLFAVQHSLTNMEEANDQMNIDLPTGTIVYQKKKTADGIIRVDIFCETKKGSQYKADFDYDVLQRRIIRWNEYY